MKLYNRTVCTCISGIIVCCYMVYVMIGDMIRWLPARQLCCEQVGYCFWRRLYACLCVCLSAQNLKNYWSEIGVTWQECVRCKRQKCLEVGDLWPWELFSDFFQSRQYNFRMAWGYIFRISWSPSSFEVMRLISRSRSQKSGSTQVCNLLGYNLTWNSFCLFKH